MHRIVTLDLGNKHSGIVVADKENDEYTISHIQYVENFDVNLFISTFLKKDDIEQHYKSSDVCIFFEVAPSFYKNYSLTRLNIKTKKTLQDNGFVVKGLSPSQKFKITGKNRKLASTQYVEKYVLTMISIHLQNTYWSFKRKHDVADALLMLMYVKTKPNAIKGVQQIPNGKKIYKNTT